MYVDIDISQTILMKSFVFFLSLSLLLHFDACASIDLCRLGKSVKKKPKVTSGSIVNAVASAPKAPKASIAVTTITPTAVSTPIQSVAVKKDEVELATKVNNIVVASNALPHGTNCLLAIN